LIARGRRAVACGCDQLADRPSRRWRDGGIQVTIWCRPPSAGVGALILRAAMFESQHRRLRVAFNGGRGRLRCAAGGFGSTFGGDQRALLSSGRLPE